MNCERYLDLISARLDGELTVQEEAELTAHLQECPACRAIAEDMKNLHSAISGMGEVAAPAELSQTVMAKIKMERAAARRRFVRRISGLAACLVLCVGAWRLSRPQTPAVDPGVPDMARHVQPFVLSDELSFTNEHRHRLSAAATSFEPTADLLGDGEAVSRFLARFPYNDLSAVAQTYDEEYFRDHRLLAVVLSEPSSSVTHTISRLTEDCVTVVRNVPQAGDSDIALWLILAEVDGAGSEMPLSVECLTN